MDKIVCALNTQTKAEASITMEPAEAGADPDNQGDIKIFIKLSYNREYISSYYTILSMNIEAHMPNKEGSMKEVSVKVGCNKQSERMDIERVMNGSIKRVGNKSKIELLLTLIDKHSGNKDVMRINGVFDIYSGGRKTQYISDITTNIVTSSELSASLYDAADDPGSAVEFTSSAVDSQFGSDIFPSLYGTATYSGSTEGQFNFASESDNQFGSGQFPSSYNTAGNQFGSDQFASGSGNQFSLGNFASGSGNQFSLENSASGSGNQFDLENISSLWDTAGNPFGSGQFPSSYNTAGNSDSVVGQFPSSCDAAGNQFSLGNSASGSGNQFDLDQFALGSYNGQFYDEGNAESSYEISNDNPWLMPETIVSTPSYPANYDQDAAGFSGLQQSSVAPNDQYMPSAQSSTTKDQGWLQDNLFAQTASTRKRKASNDADAGESVVKHRRMDDAAGFSGSQQIPVAPNNQYMPSAQSSTTKDQGWLQDNLFAQTASTRKRKSPNDVDAGESVVKHRRMDDAAGFSGLQQVLGTSNDQYMPSTQSATTQAQSWLQPSKNMSAFLPAQGEPSKSRFTDTGADVTEESQSEVEILRITNDNPTNLALRPLVAPSLSRAAVVVTAKQKFKDNSAVMPALRPLVARGLSGAEVVVAARQKSKYSSVVMPVLRPLLSPGSSKAEVVADTRQELQNSSVVMPALRPLLSPGSSKAEMEVCAKQKFKDNSSIMPARKPRVASGLSRPAVVATARQEPKYSSIVMPAQRPLVASGLSRPAVVVAARQEPKGNSAKAAARRRVASGLSGAEVAAAARQKFKDNSSIMPNTGAGVTKKSQSEVGKLRSTNDGPIDFVLRSITRDVKNSAATPNTGAGVTKESQSEVGRLRSTNDNPTNLALRPLVAPSLSVAEVVAAARQEPKYSSAEIAALRPLLSPGSSKAEVGAAAKQKFKDNSAKISAKIAELALCLSGRAEVVAAARQKSQNSSAVMPAQRPLVASRPSRPAVEVCAKQERRSFASEHGTVGYGLYYEAKYDSPCDSDTQTLKTVFIYNGQRKINTIPFSQLPLHCDMCASLNMTVMNSFLEYMNLPNNDAKELGELKTIKMLRMYIQLTTAPLSFLNPDLIEASRSQKSRNKDSLTSKLALIHSVDQILCMYEWSGNNNTGLDPIIKNITIYTLKKYLIPVVLENVLLMLGDGTEFDPRITESTQTCEELLTQIYGNRYAEEESGLFWTKEFKIDFCVNSRRDSGNLITIYAAMHAYIERYNKNGCISDKFKLGSNDKVYNQFNKLSALLHDTQYEHIQQFDRLENMISEKIGALRNQSTRGRTNKEQRLNAGMEYKYLKEKIKTTLAPFIINQIFYLLYRDRSKDVYDINITARIMQSIVESHADKGSVRFIRQKTALINPTKLTEEDRCLIKEEYLTEDEKREMPELTISPMLLSADTEKLGLLPTESALTSFFDSEDSRQIT